MENNTKKEVNLKNFIEEDNCPYCGHSIYGCEGADNDFQTHFKYNKCDECGETWTERYSLDKVECNDGKVFEYVTSEDEDMLASENKAMAEFLEKLGFTQDDISAISNSGDIVQPANISLHGNIIRALLSSDIVGTCADLINTNQIDTVAEAIAEILGA